MIVIWKLIFLSGDFDILVTKLGTMTKKDRDKHLTSTCDLLASVEKGPPTQKRVHLLTYATTLCSSSPYADFMVERNLINLLVKQLKDAQHIDL